MRLHGFAPAACRSGCRHC